MPQIPDPQDTSDAVRTCLNLLPGKLLNVFCSASRRRLTMNP